MEVSVFVFGRIFASWRQKKGWRIQQRDFKDFKKKIRHILTKKA
jgi:hypothetical protein